MPQLALVKPKPSCTTGDFEMKTCTSISMAILLIAVPCRLAVAGETNLATVKTVSAKVSTNSVTVSSGSTNFQSKVVEIVKKDPELPGQKDMDFNTTITEVPSKRGRDTFAWSFEKGRRYSFDLVVFSEYPLTSVNPDRDSIGVGLRWNWKPW